MPRQVRASLPSAWTPTWRRCARPDADHTINGRFCELSKALAILKPDMDWRWVRGPDGGPMIPRHLCDRRHLVVPHSRVLYKWGCGLMDRATNAATDIGHAIQFAMR